MKPIHNHTITKIAAAIEFIEDNLHKKLVLNDIAIHANFSPFHFHRLFLAITKETVNEFITRKRIEKSAAFLMYKKQLTITEISERVGYTSLSSFSRGFKKFYGISPLDFRNQSPEKYSKICKTESKNGEIEVTFEKYVCNINNTLNWLQMNATTTVKEISTFELAYLHHQGKKNDIGLTYNQLIKWATPKGLMNEATQMITIYHDSPKISTLNDIRMSACLVLNEPLKDKGEINTKTFTPGKCVVSRFEIKPTEFQQAWEANAVWMSENGFQKADKTPFAIHYNNAALHPEGKFIVDLCFPVE